MEQMARNLSLAEMSFLSRCRYLLHDREAKFCAAFDGILKGGGHPSSEVAAAQP